MNDRVNEELLAAAAGERASSAIEQARGGAIIVATYEGQGYSFRADGWFNATEAAKRYGKDAHEWVRLPETKRYLAALERTYGKIPHVETSRARADRGGGTWLHPKLAVKFARWLDVDFEVWCDMLIDQILRGAPLPALEDRLTTAKERIPIHLVVPHIYARTGIFYPKIYIAISAAAGADNFPGMNLSGLARVLPPLLRIGGDSDTQDDWRLLYESGLGLKIAQTQLALDLHDPPAAD